MCVAGISPGVTSLGQALLSPSTSRPTYLCGTCTNDVYLSHFACQGRRLACTKRTAGPVEVWPGQGVQCGCHGPGGRKRALGRGEVAPREPQRGMHVSGHRWILCCVICCCCCRRRRRRRIPARWLLPITADHTVHLAGWLRGAAPTSLLPPLHVSALRAL